MILIFYDSCMNVHIQEYSSSNGVLFLANEEVFYNEDSDAKLFKYKLGTTDYFIDRVLLNNQSRFKNNQVIVFDNSKEGSLYDREDLFDMLFLNRREITILKAEVTTEDVETVATWLYNHLPK